MEVVASKFEENLDKLLFKHPFEYVRENARLKALITARSLVSNEVFFQTNSDVTGT